jgi:hypothetical protein
MSMTAKRRTLLLAIPAVVFGAAAVTGAERSGVELDHVWIMVSANAPERAALTNAGFQFAPETNRHDGQGAASIAIEFENAYLELMWPDASVSVAPGLERAAEKFRQRMLWRTSGWCPFGIGLRRAADFREPFPFPTWSWTADWMPKGEVMEMLTPRDDTRSPALFVEPAALSDAKKQAARASLYRQRIGVHRITGIRLISPPSYEPIPPLKYLQARHVVDVGQGDAWLMEVTFDAGKTNRSKDLRPSLPLVIRY